MWREVAHAPRVKVTAAAVVSTPSQALLIVELVRNHAQRALFVLAVPVCNLALQQHPKPAQAVALIPRPTTAIVELVPPPAREDRLVIMVHANAQVESCSAQVSVSI